jgi:hypothetical protein
MKNVCSPVTGRGTEGVRSPNPNCNLHSSAPIIKIPTRRSNVRSNLTFTVSLIVGLFGAGETRISETRVFNLLEGTDARRYRRSLCVEGLREFVRRYPSSAKLMLVENEWVLVRSPVVLQA